MTGEYLNRAITDALVAASKSRDGDLARVAFLATLAGWVRADDDALATSLRELADRKTGQPAWLCEALNTGDGVYRP